MLTPGVIERAMTLARRRGIPIVVDPKFKHFFGYRGATIFKPNRRELEQAMGATLDLAHAYALPSSLDKLGVDNLLLTLGAEGMVLVTKDKQITRIPTMAREVFDVSGAGDTVTAWVGTALAAGASVREAAQVANYAAGVEVGKSGVATVSPAEVLAPQVGPAAAPVGRRAPAPPARPGVNPCPPANTTGVALDTVALSPSWPTEFTPQQ